MARRDTQRAAGAAGGGKPMRLSRYFLNTLREEPAEASIVSHRLMLRAGLIHRESAGIYSWLPLGWRVLRKVEDVVCEEQERAGALRLLMPTIQPASLWRESGRLDNYGPEMLRIKDRHERAMLYGPTNEEMITALARDCMPARQHYPVTLYHVQWKFRDEVRPRFGVMRGREFLMKDAYSFALDEKSAMDAYHAMFAAYMRSFARLQLSAIAVRAPSGPIGGTLSHEFHVLAETGESEIFYDAAWEKATGAQGAADAPVATRALADLYAATSDMHKAQSCPVPPQRLRRARGIEVGHIFFFGDTYSRPMKLKLGDGARALHPLMGSYGIGLSRLPAALIEAHHDERGICWPPEAAPFHVALLNLRQGDTLCDKLCEELYASLERAGVETLYDDRKERTGVKRSDMDLIGIPWQIIVGPREATLGQVEFKQRNDDSRMNMTIADAANRATRLAQTLTAANAAPSS